MALGQSDTRTSHGVASAAAAAAAGASITVQQAASVFGGLAPPPGTFVSPEAVAHFESLAHMRATGQREVVPTKLQDQWTISTAFREDLEFHFKGMAENYTVLEVGSYFGYTTRLLSQLFSRVIALDYMQHFISANAGLNADRSNILYLRFNTVEDDWSLFAQNAIQVVFLDASHDYESVVRDIENCLKIPTVGLIIFDDYGAETGVMSAVHAFVGKGILRPVSILGEKGTWRVADGREISEPEGIACEVIRGNVGVDGA
jgi:SAM-dependent methyltransferase